VTKIGVQEVGAGENFTFFLKIKSFTRPLTLCLRHALGVYRAGEAPLTHWHAHKGRNHREKHKTKKKNLSLIEKFKSD
jgi:hypothetical protein